MFRNRRDAGRQLAERLAKLDLHRPVVLGLPRGGVPVAFEVARALQAPLDVILVRKLGIPFQPELGMGAIGEDGVRVLDQQIVRLARVSADELRDVERRERAELERRAQRFRGDRPSYPLKGRTAIIVDDGIATGGTARAALQVARRHGAERVVLAVPVAASDTLRALAPEADEIICLRVPADFSAVGRWYDDFSQTTDDEVTTLLRDAQRSPAGAAEGPPSPARGSVGETVEIPLGGRVRLAGELTIPRGARGVVIFVHGSGSSRHSPRNRYVAQALNEVGLATLLFDLLTPDEELDRDNVFDIELLATRLRAVTSWLASRAECAGLEIGYFGASTGAGAALWAAAQPDSDVAAIVSRGGRADLAGSRLGAVRAPTLLIVGGEDHVVLGLNRQAASELRCEHRVDVIPGATHLFEEPGTLERVAETARDWLAEHLTTRG